MISMSHYIPKDYCDNPIIVVSFLHCVLTGFFTASVPEIYKAIMTNDCKLLKFACKPSLGNSIKPDVTC